MPAPPKPGPPTSVGKESPGEQSRRARYVAWLGARGVVPKDVRVRHTPAWSFFCDLLAPGHKRHEAAVSDAAIVTAKEPGGWAAFLTGRDPAEVLSDVGWLHGMWIGLEPGKRTLQSALKTAPALALHFRAPRVTVAGDRVEFVGWYSEPPAMLAFRFRVRVGPEGVTFDAERPHRSG